MSFDKLLESMCSLVPGSRTALVMSLDGIPVANHVVKKDTLDTEALVIELIGPLKQTQSAFQAVDAGELRTLEVASVRGTLLLSLLAEEHLVALFLDPQAIVGQGRFALRRYLLPLRQELA